LASYEEAKLKLCPDCKQYKSADQFFCSNTRSDGLQPYCKICQNAKVKRTKEKYKEIYRYKRYLENRSIQKWISNSLYSHRRKGIIIKVDRETIKHLIAQARNCPLCGVKMKFGNRKVRMNSPTIDRVNNSKIINKNNIWIICWECNMTKGKKSLKELVKFCKKVYFKFRKLNKQL
jgi:5-methylcytosine-specific restriction endonuclease McrA